MTTRSKYGEAQIAFVLKQAEDGTTIGEVCRRTGISEATFYAWRKTHAGLMPSEMRRLRRREDEDAKLKRLVAEVRNWATFGLGQQSDADTDRIRSALAARFADDDSDVATGLSSVLVGDGTVGPCAI